MARTYTGTTSRLAVFQYILPKIGQLATRPHTNTHCKHVQKKNALPTAHTVIIWFLVSEISGLSNSLDSSQNKKKPYGPLQHLSKRSLQGKQCSIYRIVNTRVVDPEPDGSALTLVSWIRIRIQEGESTHRNEKMWRNFLFRSSGCSLLRAEGFSCS